MKISTIALDHAIEKLKERTKGPSNIATNPRGRGNKVRHRLWRAIRDGKMPESEFHRRFASLLHYDTPEMNHGHFDCDSRNEINLKKLQDAHSLIQEVNSMAP